MTRLAVLPIGALELGAPHSPSLCSGGGSPRTLPARRGWEALEGSLLSLPPPPPRTRACFRGSSGPVTLCAVALRAQAELPCPLAPLIQAGLALGVKNPQRLSLGPNTSLTGKPIFLVKAVVLVMMASCSCTSSVWSGSFFFYRIGRKVIPLDTCFCPPNLVFCIFLLLKSLLSSFSMLSLQQVFDFLCLLLGYFLAAVKPCVARAGSCVC